VSALMPAGAIFAGVVAGDKGLEYIHLPYVGRGSGARGGYKIFRQGGVWGFGASGGGTIFPGRGG
jgi:hypothetical protein